MKKKYYIPIFVIIIFSAIALFYLFLYQQSASKQYLLQDLYAIPPNANRPIQLRAGLRFENIAIPDSIDNIWEKDKTVEVEGKSVTMKSSRFKVKSFYWQANGEKIVFDDNNKHEMIQCGNLEPLSLELVVLADKMDRYSNGSSLTEAQTLAYPIEVTPDLCYVSPMSNKSVGSWLSLNKLSYKESNSIDYRPDWGFLAYPLLSEYNFPTTGFPYARFKLFLFTGNQPKSYPPDYSQFTFKALENGQISKNVTIDKQGTVVIASRPAHPVEIQMTSEAYPERTITYSFEIKNWFSNPKKTSYAIYKYTYDEAIKGCGGVDNVPSVNQLSSGLSNKEAKGHPYNFPIRMINNSLTGEWGDLRAYSFGLLASNTWARGGEYAVATHSGWVQDASFQKEYTILCIEKSSGADK